MPNSRILVVDDDASISHLLKAVLEKHCGYEVREENRSFAAVTAAREFRPDLVLMDVDMPGKSGGDVAREMGQDPHLRTTPVLFLTSLISQQEAGAKPVERGGRKFLAKPVDPGVLIGCVKSLLPISA